MEVDKLMPTAEPELPGTPKTKPDMGLAHDVSGSRSGSPGGSAQPTKKQKDAYGVSMSGASRGMFIKNKSQQFRRRTRLKVRSRNRAADVEVIARDREAHPHMLPKEIDGLGVLFDEYGEPSAGGELVIEKATVKLILDEGMQLLYDNIDSDGSGKLDAEEVGTLLEGLGQRLTKLEFQTVMAELDDDNSGSVDFVEFKEWWEKRQYVTRENQDRELADLFSAVDTDGSGEIDWGEFLEMISCAPPPPPPRACDLSRIHRAPVRFRAPLKRVYMLSDTSAKPTRPAPPATGER